MAVEETKEEIIKVDSMQWNMIEDAYEGMREISARNGGKKVVCEFNGVKIDSQMTFSQIEKAVLGMTTQEKYKEVISKPEEERNSLDNRFLEHYDEWPHDYEYLPITDEFMTTDQKLNYIKEKSQQDGVKYYYRDGGKFITSDDDRKHAIMKSLDWTEEQYDEMEQRAKERTERLNKLKEQEEWYKNEMEELGKVEPFDPSISSDDTPEEIKVKEEYLEVEKKVENGEITFEEAHETFEKINAKSKERMEKEKAVKDNRQKRDNLKEEVNDLSYTHEVKRDELEKLSKEKLEKTIENNVIQ